MANEDAPLDLWSMKSAQLARECRRIANDGSEEIDGRLRAEAAQLAAEFQEALLLPQDDFQDQARRAAMLASLRKRAIEILVKVSPVG
jgi:hypothetical protein